MIIRFMLFWFSVTSIMALWFYIANKETKDIVKKVVKGFIISGIAVSIFITIIMFINNLQGI